MHHLFRSVVRTCSQDTTSKFQCYKVMTHFAVLIQNGDSWQFCKIAEAQITKIDCKNILDLRKISKLTIRMKKINLKENRYKTSRITQFGNSLHSRATMNKFHYKKFGIIQICVEAFSQTQIPYTPKQLSLTNTKPKNQGFINAKYKYQISDANCAQTKERATNQIQKLQHTKREQISKPQNQNQAATYLSHYSKLQLTNIK